MELDISLEMFLTVVILPALGVIAAVIKILWKKNESHVKNTIRLWEECEEDRRETTKNVLQLTREVGQLGGYETGVKALAETLIHEHDKHTHEEVWDGRERRGSREKAEGLE